MAGFKTHITTSTLIGVGYGAGAYFLYGVPWPSCALAAGLCGVSGMLPDMDSGPGRPLKESLSFAAAVVSTMLVDRFQQFDFTMESIILAAVAVYLLVRFGLAALLERFTVHRGMFHSLPAAVVFGEIAFLLASGETGVRCFKAGAVVLGYLSHLILDELYSIQWVRGRMAFKKSFGTALKLFSRKRWWPNASVYAALALLTFLSFKEPGWTNEFYQQRIEPRAEQFAWTFEDFLDHIDWSEEVRKPASPPDAAAPEPPREPAPVPAFIPNRGSPPDAPPRTTRAPLSPFDRER
jgi:membrane-bound metal-dependent hydrolase YbcI (DUF457 family)